MNLASKEATTFTRTQARTIRATAAIAVAIVFAIDLLAPFAISVQMLYALVAAVHSLRGDRKGLLIVAVTSSILVVAAIFLSRDSFATDLTVVIINRLITIAVIWAVTLTALTRTVAQSSAARQAALLATISESIPDVIFAKDRHSQMIFANPAAREAIEEAVGETAGSDSFAAFARNNPTLEANDRRVMETGVAEIIEEQTNDGRIFLATKSPLRDPRGKVIGIIGIAREITQRTRAEESQRAATEEFRALTNLIPGIVWTSPPKGGASYANDQWYEFSGCSRELPVAETFEQARHPDDHRSFKEWAEAQRTGSPYTGEVRLRSAAGVYHWFHTRAIPLRGADGQIIRWFGITSDISERKRAEQLIQESERRLQAALEAGRVFAFEWEPVSDGVVRSANSASILGWSSDARQDSSANYFERICEEDRASFLRVISSLTPENPSYSATYRYTRLDGNGVTYLEESGAAEFDDSGKMIFLRGLTADVTEKSLAAEAIAQSESRFRQLAEAMPQIVWVAEEDGRVSYYNKRVTALDGVAQNADGSWTWAPTVHPDDAAATENAWREAIEGKLLYYEVEHRLRTVDGSYRWFLSRAFRVEDAALQKMRWYGTATDVHAARSAHEALREAERKKDEFLAVLSHELRTPLTAAYGWIKLLRDPDLLDTETRALGMRAIEEGLQAQTRLIDELLDLSRIVSGKLMIEAEPLDLRTVIGNAVSSVRLAVDAKGLDLQIDCGNGPILLSGDAGRLRQVVWNLLANAIKFTPEGGTVRLIAGQDAGMATIEVSDTGAGIDAEFMPMIFNRFTQADSSTTRLHGGLGLGLAIVHHLVALHGGSVSAASEGPGRGCKFTVRIPQRETTSEVKQSTPIVQTTRTLLGRRLLVVDDNDAARELMRITLERHGAVVRSVADARSAIREHAEWKPDAVVADLGMPDIDGTAMLLEIRRREPAIRAIAVTAYAGREAREHALAAGFNGFVSKPFAPDDLVIAVEKLWS